MYVMNRYLYTDGQLQLNVNIFEYNLKMKIFLVVILVHFDYYSGQLMKIPNFYCLKTT